MTPDWGSNLSRLLPLFAGSKPFFDPAYQRRDSRRCQNSPLGLKQLTSLIFHFAKGFLAKNVLMTVQGDFRSGNSLFTSDIFQDQTLTLATITPSSPKS